MANAIKRYIRIIKFSAKGVMFFIGYFLQGAAFGLAAMFAIFTAINTFYWALATVWNALVTLPLAWVFHITGKWCVRKSDDM